MEKKCQRPTRNQLHLVNGTLLKLREIEVICLTAAEWPHKKIAARLGISKTRLANLVRWLKERKLNEPLSHTQALFVTFAMKAGFSTPTMADMITPREERLMKQLVSICSAAEIMLSNTSRTALERFDLDAIKQARDVLVDEVLAARLLLKEQLKGSAHRADVRYLRKKVVDG